MKKALILTAAFALALTLQAAVTLAGPSIDRTLAQQVNSSPLALTQVIITYDHQPNRADFDALSTQTGIVSLYANRKLNLYDDRSRPFIGVTALRADKETTAANGGMPISGSGNFSASMSITAAYGAQSSSFFLTAFA